MAYKFQSGDATLSGSVTIVQHQDLLFEADGDTNIGTASKMAGIIYADRITGSIGLSGSSVYADNFYGNGSNITGLSSDTLDIKTTVGSGSQPILNVPSTGNGKYVTGSTLFGWDNGESHLLLGATSGKTPSITIGSGHAQDGLIVFDGNNLDWCLGYDATAENFEIGTDNALGSQPVFTIDADGSGAFTFTGSAPVLTIGGGKEVDTTILFDGAAQDFYIALDDSADDLLIGLGSTVGTTPAIAIDENLLVAVKDDLQLDSDSAVLSLGAGKDATLTHDGTTGLTIAATPISIDSTGGLDLNSTTGDINFQDGGTNQLSLDMDGTAGEVIMQLKVDADDFVFKQYDGTEVFRVEDDGAFDIAGGFGSTGVTVSAAGAISVDGISTLGATTGATVSAAGLVNVNNTTNATSTTDGSLQTDGGLSVVLDAVFGDDVFLLSDSAVLNFGADSDVSLTHTDDVGLTLNSDNKLMFRDATEFVHSDADGYMHVEGATGVNLAINGSDAVSVTAGKLSVVGATPSVVIGDAGAEDCSLVFDNSAQDFYIGMDHSDESLLFGLGSTVASDVAFKIDHASGVTFNGAINYAVSSSTATTHGFSGSLPSMLIVNAASAATIKLPNTTITDLGLAAGYKVIVKRDAAMANEVTITGSTAVDLIDNQTGGIVLETAGAAVGLVYDGTEWHLV